MKRFYVAIVLCGVCFVAVACGNLPTDASQAGPTPTITPVPTAPAAARPTYTVQRGTVQETLTFSGRWLPRDQARLSFEIAGSVRAVTVQRGDTVKAGQLLADYQITNLENDLASAQLDLQAAIQRLASDEGGGDAIIDAQFALANANLSLESTMSNAPWTQLESARLSLEDAQRNLENAQRNYNDAISRPDAPASSVDSAYQSLEQAKASLKNAQNSYFSAAQSYNNYLIQVKQSENNVLQQEVNLQRVIEGSGTNPDLIQAVQAAQLRVDQIQKQIAQSSLYSPIDGVVLEVTIQPGNNVEAFNPVITIALPEPKEAIANLAFNDIQRLSVGMVGVCQELNRPETAVQCVVRQLPLSSRDADQTVRVAASLENVALGQLIEIEMPLQVRENVLWLPPAAIRTFQNRTFVVLQTADGQRVADVEIGLRTDERVEILSGVSEGDIVEGP